MPKVFQVTPKRTIRRNGQVLTPDMSLTVTRLTCKLPWGGYPKSLHSLNMKNGRSDTPLS